MAQNPPEQESPLTQELVNQAEVAEQAALVASQNNYLLRRVVLLRAQLINALNKVEELEADLAKRQDSGSD